MHVVCTYVCIEYILLLHMQINENGFISLGSRFISRTPVPFSASFFWRIIAPYWADVDLGGAGQVYYRQTTDASLMLRATFELQSAFLSFQNQTITNLLIVTWDSVGYFSRGTDKVCKYF